MLPRNLNFRTSASDPSRHGSAEDLPAASIFNDIPLNINKNIEKPRFGTENPDLVKIQTLVNGWQK